MTQKRKTQKSRQPQNEDNPKTGDEPKNGDNQKEIKTTKKNIILIINGEIIFPKIIPNLNHKLFKGVRIFEFNKPKIKKIKDIAIDHFVISPS